METDGWHPLRGGWSQLQDLLEFRWCRTFILLSCFLCPSTDNKVFLVVCWAQGLLSPDQMSRMDDPHDPAVEPTKADPVNGSHSMRAD